MSSEHWWNNLERGEQKYSARNPNWCDYA